MCIILMGMKWYVIVGLNLYFPNSPWCWASFHVLILPLVSLTNVQYSCWVLSVLYIFCDKKVKVASDSLWPHGLYSPWNSPGQNTGEVSLSLLQGIFPTQGSNPGLLHCRWVLYQLSYCDKIPLSNVFLHSMDSFSLSWCCPLKHKSF